MPGRFRRSSLTLALAGLVLAAAPAIPAAASAAQDPVPIGPHQFYSGLVNGSTGSPARAPIQTNCVGPVRPGQKGHPLPNQSVEVKLATPPATPDVGYTGSAAHSILAYLIWPSPAPPPPELVATFTSYFVSMPIPATLTVPCGGPGTMVFVPRPGSSTARAAQVPVTFFGQP